MNAGSTFSPHTFVVWLLTILIVGTLGVAACGGGEATGRPSPIAVSSGPITAASPSPTASTTPSAAGPRPAVSCALPPGLPSPHAITLGTVGWEFKPTVDIKVTDLGCFDVYQDGLALSHRVGILDEETSRLLATVTVRPKSPLDGVFRWESLAAPVVLRAGHSYLVGTEDHQKTHIAARTAEKVEPPGPSSWCLRDLLPRSKCRGMGSRSHLRRAPPVRQTWRRPVHGPDEPRRDLGLCQGGLDEPQLQVRAVAGGRAVTGRAVSTAEPRIRASRPSPGLPRHDEARRQQGRRAFLALDPAVSGRMVYVGRLIAHATR
jgi:hypothetical protein